MENGWVVMPTFGNIHTFAGTGKPGYSGDGGPAAKAELNNPFFCAFDSRGNLFVAEQDNHCVRKVEARTGRITTVAGTGGRAGFEGDGGPAARALLNGPVAVAVDAGNGDLYIVDRLNRRVRKVDGRTGIISTVAGDGTRGYGGDGGPGDRAQMKEPHDCALDGRGGLLIADVADSRVRRLDVKTGIITTFAGTGKKVREGDGGPAEAAGFAGARAVAVDPRDGTVYVCEREGNAIRRIDGRTRAVTHFAGTGSKGYEGDGGAAARAAFAGPKGLCCDRSGNLYIVDTENHAIRCVDGRTGILTTVAGGRQGAEGDGGPAEKAGLARPHGVIAGSDGALYIADSENHRVRRVEPKG